MSDPDLLAAARQRLARLEQEYQEAQTRSVALAGELLKVQNQLWRLNVQGQPDPTAYTISRCVSCSERLPFTEKDWFLTCSCAYRNLHPQRHGELTPKKWKLVFFRNTEEEAASWGWSLRYYSTRDERPPEGSVRVKLWSEKQGWLFLYGAGRRDERPRPPGERTHTWRGPLAEAPPAIDHWATRAFVEPWYGKY